MTTHNLLSQNLLVELFVEGSSHRDLRVELTIASGVRGPQDFWHTAQ